MAEGVAELSGFRGLIVWDTSKPNGQPRRCLDVSSAQRAFGFRACTTFRDGLARTVAWYEATRGLAPAAAAASALPGYRWIIDPAAREAVERHWAVPAGRADAGPVGAGDGRGAGAR